MKKSISIIIIFFALSSCFHKKAVINSEKAIKTENNKTLEVSTQRQLISEKESLIANYKASNTIINDLINTTLHLKFDYTKKQVFGKAILTLKPHYYQTDSLTLDAQSFEIHSVKLVTFNAKYDLKYTYDGSQIKINLGREYTKNRPYTIQIEYTANPEKVKKSSSWAIHANKGLYFIDSDTNNPQVWTQGETKSNSAWFPTIDSPNQKMTQEIFLTVKKDFKTLSNGKLISSVLNNDGTRTDLWKQKIPHAPYLAMIAIGKFNVDKSYWRDTEVNIYYEEKDKEKAEGLFKNTSEMIEFFSRKFNYDFPWEKYSQIVVRNFVSGAMENSGAVVFSKGYLNYSNEEQRIENEAVVAHELSHHWFGDLLTCESWANLPLNESFATYCEALWIEHKYGKIKSQKHLRADYRVYLFENMYKKEKLIRFYNKHRDNMFDAHSYQKGSLILHMLRNTVGDDAFFDALSLYLKKNEFKTVEIHNLRFAFEEVTGQDLNWFFNQWFLSKGIPELNIEYYYNEEKKISGLKIEQVQDLNKSPLYKIPAYVDFQFKEKTIRKKIEINKQTNVFEFSFSEKPNTIIFDPENYILCKKKENHTEQN